MTGGGTARRAQSGFGSAGGSVHLVWCNPRAGVASKKIPATSHSDQSGGARPPYCTAVPRATQSIDWIGAVAVTYPADAEEPVGPIRRCASEHPPGLCRVAHADVPKSDYGGKPTEKAKHFGRKRQVLPSAKTRRNQAPKYRFSRDRFVEHAGRSVQYSTLTRAWLFRRLKHAMLRQRRWAVAVAIARSVGRPAGFPPASARLQTAV